MKVTDILPADWRTVFSKDHRRIGIGVDPATTTKKKSNPTAISVIQQVGLTYFVRVLLRFKTDDPRVTTAVIRELLDLPHGLRVRRLGILSTNERFYAAALKRELSGIVPVEMIIESEATDYLGEKMLVKAYLGNQLVNTIDDGYLPVPDEPWVKGDLRQTQRDKGTFAAEPDEHGNHADAFCAIGAGLHALIRKGAGAAKAEAAAIGDGGGKQVPGGPWKNPHLSKFGKSRTIHV